MKKQLLIIVLSFALASTSQAQNNLYHYDYNFVNKIARLWIDFDIKAEYDYLDNKLLHKDFILQDGYIFSRKNDSLTEIGFFNNEQLIVNKHVYEMKIPMVGKVAIRKKGSKEWIRVKLKKNTISFIENENDLPEIVQLWAFMTTLQREIFYTEKRIYDSMLKQTTTETTSLY